MRPFVWTKNDLRWEVFVDGEIYAAYFFALQEGRPPGALCGLVRRNSGVGFL